VEVSLFVLSPEIEDRDEAEIATGRSTKRPSTLNTILSSSGSQKKDKTNLFSFDAVFCYLLYLRLWDK
jgi:hypothetical protein